MVLLTLQSVTTLSLVSSSVISAKSDLHKVKVYFDDMVYQGLFYFQTLLRKHSIRQQIHRIATLTAVELNKFICNSEIDLR